MSKYSRITAKFYTAAGVRNAEIENPSDEQIAQIRSAAAAAGHSRNVNFNFSNSVTDEEITINMAAVSYVDVIFVKRIANNA